MACSLDKARDLGQEYQYSDTKRGPVHESFSFRGGVLDSLGPYGIVKKTFLVIEKSLRTLTIVRNRYSLETETDCI